MLCRSKEIFENTENIILAAWHANRSGRLTGSMLPLRHYSLDTKHWVHRRLTATEVMKLCKGLCL